MKDNLSSRNEKLNSAKEAIEIFLDDFGIDIYSRVVMEVFLEELYNTKEIKANVPLPSEKEQKGN